MITATIEGGSGVAALSHQLPVKNAGSRQSKGSFSNKAFTYGKSMILDRVDLDRARTISRIQQGCSLKTIDCLGIAGHGRIKACVRAAFWLVHFGRKPERF